MSDVLDVYLYGIHAATLERRASEDYLLSYTVGWQNLPERVPLSTLFPVRASGYTGPLVASYLDNLLPDREDVRSRWAQDAKLATREAFYLLGAYGADVAGAIEFYPQGVPPRSSGEVYPVSDAEIERRIAAIRRDDAQWGLESVHRDSRFSLGGAQGKFALAQVNGKWHDPVGQLASTHIFKPGVHTYADSDLTEHVVMEAAHRLGLPVARSSIQRFGTERSLVVERFDRVTEAGVVRRIHQEDFAQATGVRPLQKYEEDGGPGYRDVFRVIDAVVTPEHRQQARNQFASELLYSWIVVNHDGHAKNHSLHLYPGAVILTPMYDLNSIVPYESPERVRAKDPDIASHINLAFSIDGVHKVGELRAQHWRTFARAAGIPGDEVIAEGVRLASGLLPAVNAAIDTLDPEFQRSEYLELLRRGLFARTQKALAVLLEE